MHRMRTFLAAAVFRLHVDGEDEALSTFHIHHVAVRDVNADRAYERCTRVPTGKMVCPFPHPTGRACWVEFVGLHDLYEVEDRYADENPITMDVVGPLPTDYAMLTIVSPRERLTAFFLPPHRRPGWRVATPSLTKVRRGRRVRYRAG